MVAGTPTARRITILGIPGSLRAGSLNRALLVAIAETAQADVDLRVFDLRGLPLYDADEDGDHRPAPVRALDEAIVAADALLLATPEYNFGMSGVLKNALDWVSRPAFRAPITGKPAAVVSVATGELGGYRAQGQVRETLRAMLCPTFNLPELYLGRGQHLFEGGRLTDEKAAARSKLWVEAWLRWLRETVPSGDDG